MAAEGAAVPGVVTVKGVETVVVHPLVLLSVTDHYHRVAKARARGAAPERAPPRRICWAEEP